MNPQCEKVLKTATVSGVLQEDHSSRRILLHLVNGSDGPLWVPQEADPAYRVDRKGSTLIISYGYDDEVYGSHRAHYMLPPFHLLPKGETFEWYVSSPRLVEIAFQPEFHSVVQVRTAVRHFEQTNVRGAQDLDGYIQNSCVLKSENFARQPK